MIAKKKEKLTEEAVWAMFAATDARLDKMFAETREQMAETDRRMAETDERLDRLCRETKKTDERLDRLCRETKKTDEKVDRLCRETKKTDEKVDRLCGKVDGVDKNIGYHAEQFFQDSLARTLTFGGEKYDCMIPNLKYVGKENGEFDIVLVNGKSVAIIEAKNRIHPNDVEILTNKKIVAFRKYFPRYNDCKVYLGLAGFSFSGKVLDDAKEHGIGIIKQAGKSIEIDADGLRAY